MIMKVEIITITGETNYGNRLQNYAVEQTLKNLGVDVVTFNACPLGFRALKFELKILIKYIIKRGNYFRDFRFISFNKFNRKYIHSVSKHLSDADFVVCGSDQIWNFTLNFSQERRDLYFARFVPPEKRIAYSASIGADYIPNKYKTDFVKGIKEMKKISVREYKGADIIKTLTGRQVDVTLDPTLMLNKTQWIKIAKKPNYVKRKRKFILTYFLGEVQSTRDDIRAYVKKIAKKYDLEIISLYHEWTPKEYVVNVKHFYTSPQEFVWLFANCELVITDSFHGCVFSIIMNKPFRCFDRKENGMQDMNSRMKSLFALFNIPNYCYGRTDEDLDNIFKKNYKYVETVLQEEKRKANEYLKGALNIE